MLCTKGDLFHKKRSLDNAHTIAKPQKEVNEPSAKPLPLDKKGAKRTMNSIDNGALNAVFQKNRVRGTDI